MPSVLIPIDGSQCSLRAVAQIISRRSLYARPEEFDIHLVNVQAPFPHLASSFASRAQIAGFHQDESKLQMHDACRLLDNAGVKYTCHYTVGDFGEEINRLAESLNCDQIVMGAHGRGTLQDVLLGSVSRKVVHLSKIPVLLVK